MSTQTITVHLPDHLYKSATQLAQATQRPLADILQDSLSHTLPPLDDVAPDEAAELAQLSILTDTQLWQLARHTPTPHDQARLEALLYAQSAAELNEADKAELADLQNKYGRLLVQQAHVWLLLARRGYKVPIQNG